MPIFDPRQKIYVAATTGALGDTVATFPALKLLIERGQIEKIFVDDRFMALYKLFFPEDLLVRLQEAMRVIPADKVMVTPGIPANAIDPITGEARFMYYALDPKIPLVQTLRVSPTSIHCPLVDCFSIAICDAILKDDQKNYLRVDPKVLPPNPCEGKNYVVIAFGSTTEHRKMLPIVFKGLVKYFKERNLSVVVLGKSDHTLRLGKEETTAPMFDGVDFRDCINLIDHTDLPEALAVMNSAQLVVGVDNGLLHLAALTDVPIIMGFTTVDPWYRLPHRHNVKGWNCFTVEPTSACRYCQTNTYCTYDINFYKCGIKTMNCMHSLTMDKWLKQLEKVNLPVVV